MRVPAMVLVALSFFAACGSAAAGDVYEPHAMLYYHVPFSGSAGEDQGGFGLRFDQTRREAGQPLDYTGLVGRPALLGFETGSSGLRTFTLAGATIFRADGEEGSTPGEPAKEEGVDLEKFWKETPKGWFIGIAIGLIMVSGVVD
jgi:hypothetical protein